jgi:hypothetical protein
MAPAQRPAGASRRIRRKAIGCIDSHAIAIHGKWIVEEHSIQRSEYHLFSIRLQLRKRSTAATGGEAACPVKQEFHLRAGENAREISVAKVSDHKCHRG